VWFVVVIVRIAFLVVRVPVTIAPVTIATMRPIGVVTVSGVVTISGVFAVPVAIWVATWQSTCFLLSVSVRILIAIFLVVLS
jgi:hypothetical protein